MVECTDLYDAILNGNAATAGVLAKEALDAGTAAIELVNRQMVPAMDEAGRRFESDEYFVPELLLSARAMKAAMEHIRPVLAKAGAEPAGRVVIGTVKGDLHDIGKNLVASLLEGAGFEVVDLGSDVPPERFVEAIQSSKPDLIALSALLTVTMPSMKKTIEALRSAGVRDRVKVIVGGAPVTSDYAEQIGADGYGENANGAVGLVRRLVGQRDA